MIYYFKQRIKQSAFTIAEVLIVLTILGVVASVTIPSVIKQNSNKANVVKLLKTYAMLEEANTYAVIENGPPSSWNMVNGNLESITEISSYYVPSARIVKTCTKNRDCWNDETYSLTGQTFVYNHRMSDDHSISYKLMDGTSILFDFYEKNSLSGFGFNENNISQKNLIIFVDVNGDKAPNKIGRDIFAFGVSPDGNLRPAGIDNDSKNCSVTTNSNRAGVDCTNRVIKEKAMNY